MSVVWRLRLAWLLDFPFAQRLWLAALDFVLAVSLTATPNFVALLCLVEAGSGGCVGSSF